MDGARTNNIELHCKYNVVILVIMEGARTAIQLLMY